MQTGKFEKKEREENMKLLVFWFERIQRAEPGEKITILMDVTGTRVSQADMGFSQFIIECCASYFPAIMSKFEFNSKQGVLLNVKIYIFNRKIYISFGLTDLKSSNNLSCDTKSSKNVFKNYNLTKKVVFKVGI